jgi:predicted AlkP superfamily pyrophosphatase or phosphodiesterase
MLTGLPPSGHGIVGNGWLYRDTQEVRFWQQMNSLIEGEPLYKGIKTAKMFWWFPLGADVDYYATPRPFYASDGSKAFGIIDKTECRLEEKLGSFPFHSFWGPGAGLPSSDWIARASALVMEKKAPDLSLVYLPHLDYDYQRFGPGNLERLREVDKLVGLLNASAKKIGAELIIVSEYGLVPVSKAVYLNRLFRERGWLAVRPGPFGEILQPQDSKVFAVADHQVAHLYIKGVSKDEVKKAVLELEGVATVLNPEELELNHPRSGELIALSTSDSWFAYPYWLDDKQKPDFATSVDIHRKPGYDPCELFMSSKLRAGLCLLKKKLGLRYRFDVVPLDTSLIKGSHGLPVTGEKGAVIVGKNPPDDMKDFKNYIRELILGT